MHNQHEPEDLQHRSFGRDRALRVLHVVSHMPPDRIGGVGEVVKTIHQGLLENGHDSQVLTAGISHDDSTVVRVCSGPEQFLAATATKLDMAMTADVVHFHHGEALLLLERLHRQRRRPRLMLTLHVDAKRISQANKSIDGLSGRSGAVQSRIRDPLKQLLDWRAGRLADQTTFISRAGAQEMLEPSQAVAASVVYNGVPLVPADGPVAEPTDLLFVGTAGPRKGIDLLPAVLQRIRQTLPTTTLRIVGFSPESEPALVRAFEAAKCHDAVEWIGPLSSSEVTAHYRSARMLIVPSRYEGLPMVILEAGSVGLPSVATDVGGTNEAVIDGVTGRLVEFPNAELLADASLDLLADDELRARTSVGARQRVADLFSIERQQASYLQLYTELLRTSATRTDQLPLRAT